jgi:hypothetical protein
VETWLASLDPRVLDGWLAFDRLEPISQPWMHSATICQVLWDALGAIAAAQGVELPKRSVDDWIPDRQASEATAQKSERIDPEQLQAALRRRFGV